MTYPGVACWPQLPRTLQGGRTRGAGRRTLAILTNWNESDALS